MTQQEKSRRRVSWFGVVMAFVFLGIASVGFTGDPFWLFSQATKWIAAGVLALIGIGLLVTTLPGARRRR
jgi:hypothetical protein